MYVYINSEPGLWTVGFYRPSGSWEAESDHDSRESAAERVAWLNGEAKLVKRVYATGQAYREATADKSGDAA